MGRLRQHVAVIRGRAVGIFQFQGIRRVARYYQSNLCRLKSVVKLRRFLASIVETAETIQRIAGGSLHGYVPLAS